MNVKKWRSRIFLDCGPADAAVLLAGMGRSGTTWAAEIINYDATHRIMFEPFNPNRVKEAAPFQNIQYLNPGNRDPLLARAAQKILGGKIRNKGVDLDNRKVVLHRRIVKEVRCNLMLGWLKEICPGLPVVLIVRHPLSVASSWLKLGWGEGMGGQESDYDTILSQPGLLADFPVVGEAMERIGYGDVFQRIIFQWCVFLYVPLRHLAPGDFFLLFYESLLLEPESEIRKLFAYLNRPFAWDALSPTLHRESRTNFLHRNVRSDQGKLLTGWKEVFTKRQIEQAHAILAMFGLEGVYDGKGHPAAAGGLL